VLSASIAGLDVVERQVPALLATVLAGVSIPIEYLVAGHLALPVRSLYHTAEADDGGQLEDGRERVDIAEPVLDHLRFALVDEDDCSAGAADGQRLVALV